MANSTEGQGTKIALAAIAIVVAVAALIFFTTRGSSESGTIQETVQQMPPGSRK